ncbi:unnamed protein product [Effrenium voratum]|nr:unnamed protein product [Effrenium voratum]
MGSDVRVGRNLSSWITRRSLCCGGLFVLLQNLLVLNWTAQLGARLDVPGAARAAPEPERLERTEREAREAREHGLEAKLSKALEQIAAKDLRLRELESTPAKPANPDTLAPSPAIRWPQTAPTSLGDAARGAQSAEGAEGVAPLRRESSLFSVPKDALRLFGQPPPPSVALTIGFGSVKRQKDYVLDTVGIMLGLRSTSSEISPEERASVVIVAHLADFNYSWVAHMSQRLQEEYKALVDGGQLHAIHAKEELYPPLDLCPPACNYKDEPHRVKWRSKQNVDYAFLMYYAASLSPLYLQIEDDINFAPHWISKITGYISSSYPPTFRSKENAPWRLIDFSQLGFIGKMFQASELTRLAQFLLLFYDQMPCDILLGQWVLSMTQGKKIEYWKSHSSLFQHVGIFRSLGGFQALQEKKFGKLLFDNPEANLSRTLTVVPTYDVKFLYFSGGEPEGRMDTCDFSASPQKQKLKRCWLWAKNVEANQHVTVTFAHETQVKAIFLEFGSDAHPSDLLIDGMIQVSAGRPGTVARPGAPPCENFVDLMPVKRERMVYWEEGASVPKSLPVPQVRCLRILARQSQKEWLILWQLQIRSA